MWALSPTIFNLFSSVLIDSASNTRYNYIYEYGNLISYTENNSGEITTVKYLYSEDGTLLKKTVTFPDNTKQVYEYETDENGNTTLKLDNISSISGADELGRKTFDEIQTGVGVISRAYDYKLGNISAFSSIGGSIAFLLDLSDKNWDDFFTIKY